ncbi:hypothetical protein HS5_08150 [Acidianus sp. HS-5]|nr:hypothetical protein HS5_08150 [Acidianus sp. HS-5]
MKISYPNKGVEKKKELEAHERAKKEVKVLKQKAENISVSKLLQQKLLQVTINSNEERKKR